METLELLTMNLLIELSRIEGFDYADVKQVPQPFRMPLLMANSDAGSGYETLGT